jgi:guanine nucleotide-binding protein G(i) subunit alpha
MGLCSSSSSSPVGSSSCSAEDLSRSKEIDLLMNREKAAAAQVGKLLLLGAGACGKSTLFKQLSSLYGRGFSEADRERYRQVIYQNIFTNINTLLTGIPQFKDQNLQINRQITDSPYYSQLCNEDEARDLDLTVELGHFLSLLWLDPAIQSVYKHKDELLLNDSTKYYMENLDRISSFDYLPSEDDVLRSRVQTTGIIEAKFQIEGKPFSMYDVGGQRNERKKWIACFDDVTAIIFVAALTDYSQVLYEDSNTNRLSESINLFEEICRTKPLAHINLILFLNKKDLFAEKLPEQPLADYHPEYKGENTEEETITWIREQFESRNSNESRSIYTHVTCATDRNNIRTVFEVVKFIILQQGFDEQFGLE